jgi:hypothetical protein
MLIKTQEYYYYSTTYTQTPEGYISKDIYPILITPNRQKRIFILSLFGEGYFGDIGSNHVDISAVSKLE